MFTTLFIASLTLGGGPQQGTFGPRGVHGLGASRETARPLKKSTIIVSILQQHDGRRIYGTPVVSAARLLATYDANEVDADGVYKGRTLFVVGIVDSIGTNLQGKRYITLGTGKDFEFTTVQAFFDKANEGKLTGIRPNQIVGVRGTIHGRTLNIILADCTSILSEETMMTIYRDERLKNIKAKKDKEAEKKRDQQQRLMKKAKDEKPMRDAADSERNLALAKKQLGAGDREQSEFTLKHIVFHYPKSKAADEARKLLSEIRKKP